MTFPIVLTVALCIIGIVAAFFNKFPAAVIAFIGMLIPGLSGNHIFLEGSLWFWGIATAIVTVNMYMSDIPPLPVLRYYTLGGAITGAVLGTLVTYADTGAIVGSVVGAALGFLAFRLTPAGKMNATTTQTLTIFADVAGPGVVTFCIAAITLSNL